MLSTSFFDWRRGRLSSLKKCTNVERQVKNLRQMKTIIFLMSLLPHLHDVPKWKKLAIRTHIQQVMMEEDMKVVPSPTSTG